MNSKERPTKTTDADGSARRRSQLVVTSVAAAAVLLVGGGGAYWATTAADGSGGSAATPASDGEPPPLSLDGPSEAGPGPGIAPGEPDPNGARYRASGELPDGPERAPVYRAQGDVAAADVTRLAAALGVEGTPRSVGDVWRIAAEKDSSGPVLQVRRQAPGTWTFARYGAAPKGDNCLKGKPCPNGGTPGTSGDAGKAAVSEEAAKKAAAPVLTAVGQSGARLDASQTMGATRVVNADPVIGGLPTYGWLTGIQVGADGQVVGGSGQLAKPVKGADYPVLSADKTLERMNQASRSGGPGKIGGCATPVPAANPDAAPDQRIAPCEPHPGSGSGSGSDAGSAEPVMISKAVFGLAVHSVDGRPALVPSWLFEVDPDGDAESFTITHPAVDPKYLRQPGSSASPSKPTDPSPQPETHTRKVESYAVSDDGRTLTLRFWGGVCSEYSGKAEESASEVKVHITETRKDPGKVCILIAKELTTEVTLDKPLGDRKVVEPTGQAVPLR
ncbi:hypothetical protein V1460_27085 [Streptomyces sp. SCSIO 30461]|uniref:hypothetical protein n=1 Tax=Streptomyces sp. SCSIO 30461 TaxID=3118085 RepID=UPI0030D166B8